MKTTYLIYKQVDGTRQLVKATQEEWNAILDANDGLSMKNRRLFEKSCFEDNGELDCMFIEVDHETYKEWHRVDEAQRLIRNDNSPYEVLSLDAPIQNAEISNLHEVVPSDVSVELRAIDNAFISELRKALMVWKPWAEELLNIYISGEMRNCNAYLEKKFNLKPRAVKYRKRAFEKFVRNFLKNHCTLDPDFLL